MGNIVDQGPVLLQLGLDSSITDAEQAIVHESIRKAEAAVKKYLNYDPVKRSRTEYYPRGDRTGSATEQRWEANDSVAYLRYTSGASSDEIQLQHIPVRSDTVIRLWIDYDGRFGAKSGAFAAETEKTHGEDFWLTYDSNDDDGNGICEDGILRSIGLWPLQPGSIKVVYTAGYSADEFNGSKNLVDASAIHGACILEAVRKAKRVFTAFRKNSRTGHAPGSFSSETLGSYSYSIDSALASKLIGVDTTLLGESMAMLEEFVNYGVALEG